MKNMANAVHVLRCEIQDAKTPALAKAVFDQNMEVIGNAGDEASKDLEAELNRRFEKDAAGSSNGDSRPTAAGTVWLGPDDTEHAFNSQGNAVHLMQTAIKKANTPAAAKTIDTYKQLKDGPSVACQRQECFGCCLHQKEVDSSPFETDRILDRIAHDGNLVKVVERAERLVASGRGGACPLLLQNGKCSVYRIRPLSCAAYHSLDRQACHSGARAEIPHADRLFVQTAIIAAFGMFSVDAVLGPPPRPRFPLFKGLAERGRARLQQRKAA